MKEEMQATWSEIKENIQWTKSEGKETGTPINNLEQKEEISMQLEQNEETKFKEVKRVLRTSGTAWNVPISEL